MNIFLALTLAWGAFDDGRLQFTHPPINPSGDPLYNPTVKELERLDPARYREGAPADPPLRPRFPSPEEVWPLEF